MSHKVKLASLTPEVIDGLDALPSGGRSAFIDGALRVALGLPAIEVYTDRRERKVTPAEARGLIAEHGSAARAARAIGVAESTIGRAAKKP